MDLVVQLHHQAWRGIHAQEYLLGREFGYYYFRTLVEKIFQAAKH